MRVASALVAAVLVAGGVSTVGAIPADLSPEQRGWALATSALVWERNGDRHDLLAGRELTGANALAWRELLERTWRIRSRSDLVAALAGIHAGGTRRQFRDMGQWLASLGPEQRNELDRARREQPELDQRVLVVEAYWDKLGPKDLVGWDYSRYVALCRRGYGAGYLTEDEAWSHIIRAARLIQATFSSWKELGENYLIGREFWSPKDHRASAASMRQALHRLLSDPESPWQRHPWNLDLGSRPAGERDDADRRDRPGAPQRPSP